MNKVYVILAVVALVALTGCATGGGTSAPEIRQNVFTADGVTPCIRIVFPDTVEYISMARTQDGAESVIRYNVAMRGSPFYDIGVVKVNYTEANAEWAVVPISRQFAPEEKLYEMEGGLFVERSSVIIFYEKPDGIYLRGIVGEFVSSTKAYMVIIDRMIHRAEYRQLFAADTWRESSTGRIFINDMIKTTDWFYFNMEQTACLPDSSVRRAMSR